MTLIGEDACVGLLTKFNLTKILGSLKHRSNNMNINMSNGRVVVNGTTYHGNNIIVKNGQVTIDGVVQNEEYSGNIEVVVHGD